MNVQVHGSGVEITARLRNYISRKAESILTRFSECVTSLSVTLEDTNGPRGGVDQVCRITVNLQSHRKPLVVESMHTHTGGAIKLAFDKSVHAIRRSLDRRQRMRRRVPVSV